MCPQRDDLACAEVRERLEAFVDGDLPAAEAESTAGHLASCAECSEELRLAEEIVGGLRSLGRLEAPLRVLDEVRNAAGAPEVPGRRRRLTLFAIPRVGWSGLAAAALVLIAIGTVIWREQLRPAHPDEAVVRATAEARIALAYVGLAGRMTADGLRTDLLRDRVVSPTIRGLSRSLKHVAGPAVDRSHSPAAPTKTAPRTRS